MDQIFCHFQTDKTATDDDSARNVVLIDPGLDLVAVGNVSKLKDTWEIASRKLGDERLGACGENKIVVGLFEARPLQRYRIFTFLR